jgi:hypothetical protein
VGTTSPADTLNVLGNIRLGASGETTSYYSNKTGGDLYIKAIGTGTEANYSVLFLQSGPSGGLGSIAMMTNDTISSAVSVTCATIVNSYESVTNTFGTAITFAYLMACGGGGGTGGSNGANGGLGSTSASTTSKGALSYSVSASNPQLPSGAGQGGNSNSSNYGGGGNAGAVVLIYQAPACIF